MARLLIIEDDPKILRSLGVGLRAEGHEGHRLAATGTFDRVILDRMLPGRDGLEVLAQLRRAGDAIPVLALTARDAVEDRVAVLDGGADDRRTNFDRFRVADLGE